MQVLVEYVRPLVISRARGVDVNLDVNMSVNANCTRLAVINNLICLGILLLRSDSVTLAMPDTSRR